MALKDKIGLKLTNLVNNVTSVAQKETERETGELTISDEMKQINREIAGEGAILLKNNSVLPLKNNTTVSVFGRVSSEYYFVGFGSGGDVNRPYEVSLIDGIRNCNKLNLNEELQKQYDDFIEKNPKNDGVWAMWPSHREDMALSDEIVKSAREKSDVAIYTIGRAAGEDKDIKLDDGGYYLLKNEIENIKVITNHFDKVVLLLNVGNIIDMSEIEKFGDKIGAIMIVWQGGMESGNAVADLLCGEASPSGKLTDTIARDYIDYPSSDNFNNKDFNEYEEDIFVGYRYFESFKQDAVLYPFGYGLSYTNFEINHLVTTVNKNGFSVEVEVKNTNDYFGKEVVQLYLEKPCGKLGNPKRILVAFKKTKTLYPNESEKLTLDVDLYSLASYDDCGSTNLASCYVIEAGEYNFYVGNSVRENEKVFTYYQNKTEVFEELRQAAAPRDDFRVFHAEEIDGVLTLKSKKVAKEKFDMATRILNHLPKKVEYTGFKGILLDDVKNNKATLDEFIAQLDTTELEAITRGDYEMNSPLGAKGNAGAFGGVLETLRQKGIPATITTDGPSGIRLGATCSLLPIGTCLASSFNEELVEKLYTEVAKEMAERGSNVLLAPGMNIHRNALCGRNFEYFSEDPLVSGKIAAAVVKGVQSGDGWACPKHFACNNQEFRRIFSDSRVSERALREIYLKGFEICVKEAKPKCLMTSYNKINGVWGHYNYDLVTTILRREWGYEGVVITDWWMRKSKSPEFPNLRDQAYRVRAGVDVLMPGGARVTNRKPDGTLLKTLGNRDGITLGEIQDCARHVLKQYL